MCTAGGASGWGGGGTGSSRRTVWLEVGGGSGAGIGFDRRPSHLGQRANRHFDLFVEPSELRRLEGRLVGSRRNQRHPRARRRHRRLRAVQHRFLPGQEIVLVLARRRGRVLGLAALEPAQQVHEGELRDELEGLGDAAPRAGDRFDERVRGEAERFLESVDREDVRQVPLVVLDDDRDPFERHGVGLQVLLEVLPALEVFRQVRPLRVGHEHDPVRAPQDDTPRLVEGGLPGDRRQLEPDLVSLDVAQLDREQVEVDGPIRLCREVEQFPDGLRVETVVEKVQVGRLAAQTRTVIDDLGGQLPRGGVVDNHKKSWLCGRRIVTPFGPARTCFEAFSLTEEGSNRRLPRGFGAPASRAGTQRKLEAGAGPGI